MKCCRTAPQSVVYAPDSRILPSVVFTLHPLGTMLVLCALAHHQGEWVAALSMVMATAAIFAVVHCVWAALVGASSEEVTRGETSTARVQMRISREVAHASLFLPMTERADVPIAVLMLSFFCALAHRPTILRRSMYEFC